MDGDMGKPSTAMSTSAKLFHTLSLVIATFCGCSGGGVTLSPEDSARLQDAIVQGFATGDMTDTNDRATVSVGAIGPRGQTGLDAEHVALVLELAGHSLRFYREVGQGKVLLDERWPVPLDRSEQEMVLRLWIPKCIFQDDKLPEILQNKILAITAISFVASRMDDYVIPGLFTDDSVERATSQAMCRALLSPDGAAYKAVMPRVGSFAGVIKPVGEVRENIAKASKDTSCEPDGKCGVGCAGRSP
jgi:hypothetical protein